MLKSTPEASYNAETKIALLLCSFVAPEVRRRRPRFLAMATEWCYWPLFHRGRCCLAGRQGRKGASLIWDLRSGSSTGRGRNFLRSFWKRVRPRKKSSR